MLDLKNVNDVQASLLRHASANFLYLKMIVFGGVIPCSVVDRREHCGFETIDVVSSCENAHYNSYSYV